MSLDFKLQLYRINDIIGWDESTELVLSPNFQRRKGAWNLSGKSYLIDTILRGAPMPPFFVREKISVAAARKTRREVVDGQQRLRTILEYFRGRFTMLPVHNKEFARKTYDQLPETEKIKFLSYQLSVNVLIDADEAEVLEIFRRINSYVVPLNAQEKLNAEYLGAFRQSMLVLTNEHRSFWEQHKLLNSTAIARMQDVQLTADLVAAMMRGGVQEKSAIRPLYGEFDTDFLEFEYIKPQFALTLDACDELLGEAIPTTIFRRVPLFYSLFCAVYDCYFGFGSKEVNKPRLTQARNLMTVRESLLDLSGAVMDKMVHYQDLRPDYSDFYRTTLQSTDKLPERLRRHQILVRMLAPVFKGLILCLS